MDFAYICGICVTVILFTYTSSASLPLRPSDSPPVPDPSSQQGTVSSCTISSGKWIESKLRNLKTILKRVSQTYKKLEVHATSDIPNNRLSERLKPTGAAFCASSMYYQLDIYRQVFQQLSSFYKDNTHVCRSSKKKRKLCKFVKAVGQAVNLLQENITDSHPDIAGERSELVPGDAFVTEAYNVDDAHLLGASLALHLRYKSLLARQAWRRKRHARGGKKRGQGRRKKQRGASRDGKKTAKKDRRRKKTTNKDRQRKRRRPNRRSNNRS